MEGGRGGVQRGFARLGINEQVLVSRDVIGSRHSCAVNQHKRPVFSLGVANRPCPLPGGRSFADKIYGRPTASSATYSAANARNYSGRVSGGL